MEIKFNNVSLVLNRKTPLEKTILKDISFDIKEPGIYAFFGNSNSGKSAIGELLDALIRPTKGEINVGKFKIKRYRIKNINKLRFDVGYLFKNPYDMFINKTVEEEIEFGMQYFRYKLEKVKFRTKDALKMVGLNESYLDKNPLELELNDAKKVALASIIVFNPKILILDEPTVGLNYREKQDLYRLLRMLKTKYNRTIIILSKDSNFLYPIVDYVYLLDKGRLVTHGEKNIFKEIALLESLGLEVPNIIKFIYIVKKEKNIILEDYKDIKDLIKGVYRNV